MTWQLNLCIPILIYDNFEIIPPQTQYSKKIDNFFSETQRISHWNIMYTYGKTGQLN